MPSNHFDIAETLSLARFLTWHPTPTFLESALKGFWFSDFDENDADVDVPTADWTGEPGVHLDLVG